MKFPFAFMVLGLLISCGHDDSRDYGHTEGQDCTKQEKNIVVSAMLNTPIVLLYQSEDGVLFRFTNALYTDSGTQSTESITYDLGDKAGDTFDRIGLSSSATYDIDTSGGGRFRELVSGSQEISADGIDFSWSYGSPDKVFIYLPYESCD